MQTPSEVTPTGVTLQDWNDVPAKRQSIFDGVKTAIEAQFPREYSGVRMELHNTRYEGPEDYDIKEQKEALLDNKFLHRKLKGTVRLFDSKDGKQLDERDLTLMRVPFLTDRHTFIHNGSEYSILHQARLQPGAYTRRKSSGELETHFNTKRGTGPSFRVRLEPESGLFRLDSGQSSLRLYSLLHDLGVPDEQLEKTWGPELLKKNREAYDSRVFEKAYARLVRRPKYGEQPVLDREQKAQAIRDALAATKLDRKVMERTLPNLFSKQAMSMTTNSVSPTSQMKLGPHVIPPFQTDGLSARTFNSDTTDGESNRTSFHRDDYLMLAKLLDEKFHARIPLDLQEDQLVEAIMRAMQEMMPGFDKEMLGDLISSKKEASPSLGCLMAVLDPIEAVSILDWSKEHFKPADLALDGIEQMPHATCLYGFKPGFNVARLEKLLAKFGPVHFTFKEIKRFADVQDGKADAVVVALDSPDLVRLNTLLEEKFGYWLDGSRKKPYKPHLTLAYVKPGAVKSLDGHAWFSGGTYLLKKLVFKTAGGKRRIDMPLGD